jgi:hypothetical protein
LAGDILAGDILLGDNLPLYLKNNTFRLLVARFLWAIHSRFLSMPASTFSHTYILRFLSTPKYAMLSRRPKSCDVVKSSNWHGLYCCTYCCT